jgi:HTH-type transcriptional regulator / antitoxin HigA
MSPPTTTYKGLVAEHPPKAIHIEREYHDWQKILGRFLAKPDDQLSDAEAAYAETIALLIEAYEKHRYPLSAATPAEALAELLKAHDLRQKGLVDVFGSEAEVSYVLNGKRGMTPEQFRRLTERFHVSPAVFI